MEGPSIRHCSDTMVRHTCAQATVAATLVLLTGSRALADYPVMSHRYLADPGSLVYDGRIYLYNSNDDDNGDGSSYKMHSIVCVSTSDLKNWTDHGIVFEVPANASWAQNSWAPQAIERDGKILLYFGNSGSGIGVASSTSPTGGFKDAKGGYLVNGSTPGASGTDSWLFDPGAFIDEDGQAYLSFGGNGVNNGRIIKLGSDLVSVSGSASPVSTTNFYEASFLFKRKGIYYFSYSTNPDNGLRIDYLTSSSPQSGYTYRGTIAGQPPDNGDNNHASQFEFNGQWYHAYHNRYVAIQAGLPKTYRRNLGIEVLDFDADGKVQEVKYTTDGVPQVGNLDPYARVEAETMNAQSGIETEACKDGGMDVTQISSGDWIRVRGVDFGSTGASSFSARVASSSGGGSIEAHLTGASGKLLGTCTVPATGGAQVFATTTCDVTGATGVADLYFKFTASNTQAFSFDAWQFTRVGGASGGSAGAGGESASGGSPANGGISGGGRASSASGVSNGGSGAATKPSSTSNQGGASSTTRKTSSGGASGSSRNDATTAGGSQASHSKSGHGTTATTPSPLGGSGTTAATDGVSSAQPPSDAGACSCRSIGRTPNAHSLGVLVLGALLLRRGSRRRVQR